MRKIKDRITLGAITGIVISAPFQMFDALIHELKITDVSYGYSASNLFLTKDKTTTSGGKTISSLVNFVNSGLVATAITYTLALTGKDKAILKGVGIGAMMWVGISGLISNVGLNIKSKKPSTPLISFAEHLLHGAMCSYMITKIGDDSLFPDNNNVNKHDKIPVVYSRK